MLVSPVGDSRGRVRSLPKRCMRTTRRVNGEQRRRSNDNLMARSADVMISTRTRPVASGHMDADDAVRSRVDDQSRRMRWTCKSRNAC